jgi:hypothetical protein
VRIENIPIGKKKRLILLVGKNEMLKMYEGGEVMRIGLFSKHPKILAEQI